MPSASSASIRAAGAGVSRLPRSQVSPRRRNLQHMRITIDEAHHSPLIPVAVGAPRAAPQYVIQTTVGPMAEFFNTFVEEYLALQEVIERSMSALVSVILEHRLAVLAEGAHRFGTVLGGLDDREMRRGEVQARPQVGGQRLVHRSLDHRYGHRRLPGDAGRKPESLAHQLVVRVYMADDPHLAGLLRGQQVTGPEQFQGPCGADQPRQEVRAAGAGDQPDPDVSRAESGGLGGAPDV